MTCPAENTWLRYLGGGLEQHSVHELESHLDHCGDCRMLYAGMARDDDKRAAVTAREVPNPLAAVSRAPLERGASVGRYIILGVLGRGGMGIVYKAFDPELDRTVALKLVGVGGLRADPEDARNRLLREAKTLARLSHPNVVVVHDVGAFGDDLFVAMEYVTGTTLRQWLRERPRKPREVLGVFVEAGRGLAAAHRLGIVHRDFKPENVMVEEGARVRVLDFGLARSLEHVMPRPSLPSIVAARTATAVDAHSELTRDGAIVGTPPYMAPEQDAGGEIDARSDQFSFCAALFEALYGVRPFEGTTYAEISERRIKGEVRTPPATRGVPTRARRALLKGLRPSPGERHVSMEALLVELGAHRWSKGTRIATALLAVTVVASGGVAVWFATHSPPTIEESCEAAVADVGRVWNDKRRAELVQRMVDAKVPDARGVAARVATQLDSWTSEWTTRRQALCEQAMRSDVDQSQDIAHQVSCLRRRLGNLDAVVSVVTHTTVPQVASSAGEVIATAPRPSTCDSYERSTIDDDMRSRWAPVMQGIVAARVALAGGSLDEAERTARDTVATARLIPEREALGAALGTLGEVLGRRGKHEEARTTLLEAIRIASAAREHEIVAEAWLSILNLAFDGYDKEIESAIFATEVAVQSLPVDDPAHCSVAYKVGSIRAGTGTFDAAIPLLEQAIACWKRISETKHKHDIAGVENTLGLIHSARAEWNEAKRSLERALATWESIGRPHPNIALVLGSLGEIALAQGDHATAEQRMRRSVEVAKSAGAEGKTALGDAEGHLAYLLIRMKRCAEALPLLASARTHHAALHGEESSKVAGIMLGQAMCELEAGRAAKAIELLEKAKPIADAKPSSISQIALTDFTLARALLVGGGSKKRAIELAQRADEYLAKYKSLQLHRDEVVAWLAKHR